MVKSGYYHNFKFIIVFIYLNSRFEENICSIKQQRNTEKHFLGWPLGAQKGDQYLFDLCFNNNGTYHLLQNNKAHTAGLLPSGSVHLKRP